jgi:hypothetical protein
MVIVVLSYCGKVFMIWPLFSIEARGVGVAALIGKLVTVVQTEREAEKLDGYL